MSKRSDKLAADAAVNETAIPAAETAAETAATEQEKTSVTQVYCGPTVRGVAKQYTVFRGGIPGLRRRSGRSENPRRLQQTQRQNQHGEAQRAPSPGSGNCILCRFTHVDWFRLFVLC